MHHLEEKDRLAAKEKRLAEEYGLASLNDEAVLQEAQRRAKSSIWRLIRVLRNDTSALLTDDVKDLRRLRQLRHSVPPPHEYPPLTPRVSVYF